MEDRLRIDEETDGVLNIPLLVLNPLKFITHLKRDEW